MIDPINITNYNLTHAQLEEHLLFWVFAAGHNALSTARGLDKFLTEVRALARPFYLGPRPFVSLDNLYYYTNADVPDMLRRSGLGCWRIKSRTVKELVDNYPNLKTCTVDDLEAIHGIGPKTARCFLLHSREGFRAAGLDTHILKFLRDQGIDAPKSTPTGKKYKVLENEFLRLCDEAGKSPAAYDLEIWNRYKKKLDSIAVVA